MARDHPPALGKAHPGLGLAPDLAGRTVAAEQGRGDGVIAPVGGDDRFRQGAHQAYGGARNAETLYLVIAVEVLGRAVADGPRIVTEDFIERVDVIRDQRPLVTLECSPHLGDHIGEVNLHIFAHADSPPPLSFPRKREPIFERPLHLARWVPAFAGTTAGGTARSESPSFARLLEPELGGADDPCRFERMGAAQRD